MKTITNLIPFSLAFFLLFMAIFLNACDWASARRLTLDLNYENKAVQTLSADGTSNDISKAVKVTDEIMTKYGLKESNLSTAQKEDGGIKEYFRPAENNKPPITCTVYQRKGAKGIYLELIVSEYLAVKLSETSKSIISDLQSDFIKEYGAKSIKIR